MDEIVEKLNKLDEFCSKQELIQLDKQKLIDSVLTPEIKQKLADIDAEFAQQSKAVTDNIAALREEIEALTLVHGETVRGDKYMAVWNKGRISWDTGKLDGLCIAYPPLKEARKEGTPSITIRKR